MSLQSDEINPNETVLEREHIDGAERRSERIPKPTDKMVGFQEQIDDDKKKHWTRSYTSWKKVTRSLRDLLKTDCDLNVLNNLKKDIEQQEKHLLAEFEELRRRVQFDQKSVRRMDASIAVTGELMKITNERLSELDTFNEDNELKKLEQLKHAFITQSIFSEPVSHNSLSSRHSNISEKAADAAAELAVKETELRLLQRTEEEKSRRDMLEEAEHEHKRFIAEQQKEIQKMKLEREIEIASARLTAYQSALKTEEDSKFRFAMKTDEPLQPAQNATVYTDTDKLVKAFADSINISRLPVPEPSIFNGDPLAYLEWKTSFQMLIEKRGIPANERIYYLKRYVGGDAKGALEGFYLSSTESAYDKAQRLLDERYGHPFVLQRAFRDKLENWPRVGPKDPFALRDLADFLRGCLDAIPHVPSLAILNDCIENQKLLKKLPDWISTRWNREVTEALGSNDNFPNFERFVMFLVKEARVACNPITSLSALQGNTGSRSTKEKTRSKVEVLTTSTTESKQECGHCKGAHHITKCTSFLALSLADKRTFIRKSNLCYGCLARGHQNKDCKKKHTCGRCKGKHPTCLHEERQKDLLLNPEAPTFSANSNATDTSSCGMNRNNGQGTSMIVPVWVSHTSDRTKEVLTYALLDTQSDTTFILEDLATNLQISHQPIKLNLSTMTSQNTIIDSFRVCDLEVRGFNSTDSVAINQSYTRNFIPADRTHIPQRKTAQDWPHLKEVVDVIPPLQSCEVGLLIGYNCPQALAPRQILMGEQSNDPFAVKTLLGWSIVGGSNRCDEGYDKGISHRIVTKEIPPCTPKDLIRVFETDFNQESNNGKCSQEDLTFLDILEKGIITNDSGHLEMPLPFKERPILPNNKVAVLQRMNQLKRKMAHGKFHQDYTKFMTGIIERDEAELVTDESCDGNIWYIPHHGVYHAKKPEKIRVVFDCSARYRNTSLNQHLLTGPDLTNGLVGVLCRFRENPVAIMCDIEGMFHQFHVPEEDRNFLRFLWWENGDVSRKLQEYRMKVHLFGAASSPGCANYGLKYLASSVERKFPAASKFVKRNFYVDDGLTSVETTEEAISLINEARTLCEEGGLHLHKFMSNQTDVLNSIPADERAKEVRDVSLSLERLPVERALGVKWCVDTDTFKFEVTVNDQPATRRSMLSTVASLFDPIGLLSPFTLKGKMILQEMCQKGIDWDEPISESLKPEWENWIQDLHNLQLIEIPRALKPKDYGKPERIELHHFSDASSSGYGQCSYVRYLTQGKRHCTLVMAKSRVAPRNIVTIPRLELTAAVLSVKMSLFLREELDLQIDQEYFWTDSRVVLGYINNDARRFHVFVANRVQAIRNSTDPNQWNYVSSEENPADLASRGLPASGIMNSKWINGPMFLWEKELKPKEGVEPSLQLGDPEVRVVTTLRTTGEEITTKANLLETLTERFSSWDTVVSVVARLKRLAEGVKGTQPLSVEERQGARRKILKLVQADAFDDCLSTLKARTLPKSSNLFTLNPTVIDGLLCVGGRLRKAGLSEPFKHPVILPKNSHVTRLILRHVHEKAKHQGRGMTLNFLRSNGYWIIGASKAVAQYIRNCVVCRKLRRPAETQQMADLPNDRVQPSPPFLYCGMDCFGPFIVKNGRKEIKRYGLLFTCMCTRAIHIEMIEDMSTDAFINGLRCFIGIRGAVRQLRSDQGTNFVGARNEFRKAIDIDKMTSFLGTKQCDFVFNAPSSSHTGGVWERQIRTIRSVLDSILLLCPGRLDDSSLRALFYEVMSIVNCRPLTVNEVDSHTEPLTPNHILTAKSEIPLPPPGDFTKEDLCLRKRWRRVQYLLEQFWARWKKEYLAQLCVRQKWHAPKRNIKINDIVLVKDIDLPRNQWPLARVIGVTVDDDGLVRRAKVSLAKGDTAHCSVLERSVHKLVLLLEN